MPVLNLGTSSRPIVAARRKTCKLQNSFCVGSGTTDTEHSTTSGSNKEVLVIKFILFLTPRSCGDMAQLVSTRLEIKRLQNLGLTLDAVARCCAFGKDT